MKTGISLVELAHKIENTKAAKRDYIASTGHMVMQEDARTVVLDDVGPVVPTHHCHQQIGDRLQIPTKYYRRMQEDAPDLLAANVNRWFRHKPEARMIRCLVNNTDSSETAAARAFLSDRYNRIENEEIAEAILPVLLNATEKLGTELRVESCELTDRRMYIKAVTPQIKGEVAVGDEVQAGVLISNSEIGLGQMTVQPLIYRLVCTNGMVLNDSSLKRKHLGARAEAREGIYELLTDEAREAGDKALMLEARDVTAAVLSQTFLDRQIAAMREAAGHPIESRPDHTVTVLAKKEALTDAEHTSVLQHLIEGGDLSQYGLMNAVTRASQDVEDYDRATELESLGGKILTLHSSQWKELAQAA